MIVDIEPGTHAGFLTPEHLSGVTKATVVRVELKPIRDIFKGGMREHLIAFFLLDGQVEPLTLIVGKILKRQLAEATGSRDTDKWIGQTVALIEGQSPKGDRVVHVGPKGMLDA
jgi:hypothetical protein